MAEQMIQNISGITGGEAQVHVRRVVCLYRVSSVGQVEKDDIPMQKQSCREFVQRQTGWEIVKEFSEKGVSGFKKSAKDRDAIQEIQKLALQGGFDILLVFMFDRLGRRDDETPFVVEWFVKQNIEVWSAMEGQQRFDNHVDKLLNYIRYWQASGESIKTSMRVKTRIEQLTQEGHFTGGRAPFGYRAEKTGRMNKKNQDVRDLVIDPEDAEIVKLIFQKYVYEGYGALRLCRYFREQGIRRKDGGEVTVGMINRAVKNSIYIGVIHRGDSKSEVLPDLKIIDEELFFRALEIAGERKVQKREVPLTTRGRSLLVGNVYCGCCGARLMLATSGHKYQKKDGTVSTSTCSSYKCYNRTFAPGDGKTHDYTHKPGVVHTEIMLPAHAPPEFQDRSTLWNVEEIEKSSDAQLAREIKVALSVELSRAEHLALVRSFVKDNFVAAGMCADLALHDKCDREPPRSYHADDPPPPGAAIEYFKTENRHKRPEK